ncbi:MAG TPA: hypothetical protein VLQ45_28455 [Thermoanaerobaculia bacterium]|nr:hypothetical protein [Thermoanaerobaculia bacterium]
MPKPEGLPARSIRGWFLETPEKFETCEGVYIRIRRKVLKPPKLRSGIWLSAAVTDEKSKPDAREKLSPEWLCGGLGG